jgi:hypothetical protein
MNVPDISFPVFLSPLGFISFSNQKEKCTVPFNRSSLSLLTCSNASSVAVTSLALLFFSLLS